MAVRERRIGIISDTHGLLRPQAVEALRGSELVIHAGDIGNAEVLDRLSSIAPVTAVRGNNDHGPWAAALNDVEIVEVADAIICIVHDLAQLDVDPVAEGFRAVVSGHSHRPAVRDQGGVLYVNPGSAGPRRFSLPVSVGSLVVDGGSVHARLVTLSI